MKTFVRPFLVLGLLVSLGFLAGCGDVADVGVESQESALASCTVSKVSSGAGAWRSQTNPVWALTLLGNSSTKTIGGFGGVISSLATTFATQWSNFSTTPASLNTAAKAAGCFPAGSGDVNVSCAINSLGGVAHVAVPLASLSDVATAICGNVPVLANVAGPDSPAVLIYKYSGGAANAPASYTVVDPKGALSKSLSGFTPTLLRRLQ